jgi:hypothetical protein
VTLFDLVLEKDVNEENVDPCLSSELAYIRFLETIE